ncbi:hypothetical protein JB92DRAFT_2749253, partial [Gautieria morchelliformis]
LVGDVEAYPGHIACDGETKSEMDLPIVVDGNAIGRFDVDCLVRGISSEEDRAGESIVKIIVDSCDSHIQQNT